MKLVMMVCTLNTVCSLPDLSTILTMFRRHLDCDGDGRLSLAELQQLIAELGIDGPSGLAAAEAEDVIAAVMAGFVPEEGITFETFAEFHRKVLGTRPVVF